MRASRRSDAPLLLALTAPVVLLCAAHAGDASKPAGGAPPADVPWDTIEAWAGGNSIPDSSKVAETKKASRPEHAGPDAQKPAPPTTPPPPPPEVKPAWTPSRPGEHRPEPPQIAEHRLSFLRRAENFADRAEKSRDLERAFLMYYRMQRFPQALQELAGMKQDSKHFADKETWVLEKWIETGLVMVPQMPRPELEARFAEWKKRRLEKIKEEEGTKDFNKEWWMRDTAQREAMLNEKPSVTEFLVKREQQGEADPAILWETCNRYVANHPHDPLHYMSTLYKMREWYPEHEAVKSGEVQWRLVNVLCNDLELHKEGADEAVLMQEKFPRNPNVLNGDNLWYAAENRRLHADENHPKREQIDLWKDAKALYEEFKQSYPQHARNHLSTPQDKKSDCQYHIDELRDRIR